MPNSPPEGSSPFLNRVRAACRRKGYTYQTEKTYLRWIIRYVKYHGTRHPRAFGKAEVREYLSYLATERNVAASTQNQALNALLFLHRDVLGAEWEGVSDFERAQEPERLPVVLTQAEVKSVLGHMDGPNGLVAHLLYGAGLRLPEALRLRAKDLDFEYGQITVRQGKGKKDRRTMLPGSLKAPLRRQLRKSKAIWEEDLEAGYGRTSMPKALERKYPNAAAEWGWLCALPSVRRPKVREAETSSGITALPPPCKRRSSVRWRTQALPSPLVVTPYGIRLRHTSWGRARTFAPCRSFSATRISYHSGLHARPSGRKSRNAELS
jgi:integron integrase